MSELRFKYKSSKDFGILSKCPHVPPAQHRFQTIEIPGGSPVIYDDGLKAITTPDYEIGIVHATEENVLAATAWLTGKGDLWLSCEPTKIFRNAYANNVSVKYLSRKSAMITVNFLCDSYRYNVENTVETLEMQKGSGMQNFAWVDNNGAHPCRPTLYIQSDDWFTVWVGNGKHCEVHYTGGDEVKLDTENLTLVRNGVVISLIPELSAVQLETGRNYLVVDSPTLRSVKIVKNERW